MSTDDKVGGKTKEWAGKATGNDELESEGRTQHAKGKASEAIDDAKDAAGEAKDGAKGTWDATKDQAKGR